MASKESVNILIVELTALLHDIADHKFHGGDRTIGPKVAKEWLKGLGVKDGIIDGVCDNISKISFSSGKTPESKEGKIVQDADRLDASGAIGIARCFAYGGYREHLIHSFDKEVNTGIKHFHDKLPLLKDMMNTETGKKMAEERHQVLENFLKQFYKEWEVKNY